MELIAWDVPRGTLACQDRHALVRRHRRRRTLGIDLIPDRTPVGSKLSGRVACARPNLKTRLAVTPASASAPTITSSSICIEGRSLFLQQSVVASASGGVAGRGAGAALACGLAGGSAAARARIARRR